MDLNYLLHRHQVSLALSDNAVTVDARHAHRGMARGYAARIGSLQRALGATFTTVAA